MNNKQERMAQQIFKQLAVIIQREVKDPRLGIVTISEVKLTKDMSLAKIYITAIDTDINTNMGSDLDRAETRSQHEKNINVVVLNKMAGFLRTELAARLQVRSVPALKFYLDTITNTSTRIQSILDSIRTLNRDENNNEDKKEDE